MKIKQVQVWTDQAVQTELTCINGSLSEAVAVLQLGSMPVFMDDSPEEFARDLNIPQVQAGVIAVEKALKYAKHFCEVLKLELNVSVPGTPNAEGALRSGLTALAVTTMVRIVSGKGKSAQQPKMLDKLEATMAVAREHNLAVPATLQAAAGSMLSKGSRSQQ